MNNSHDEIKKLLKASQNMLSSKETIQESKRIKEKYGIVNLLFEQDTENVPSSVTKKIDVGASIEDTIDDDIKTKEDKKQAYRISGGIIVLHGKTQNELELTTDEKTAFQETMDEFVQDVSDLVDFNRLNVYPNNVEWSGKLIDFDIEFMFSVGEESGIYINGDMIKMDDTFLETITKLKTFYEKFKSKWAKVMAFRKKTKKSEE